MCNKERLCICGQNATSVCVGEAERGQLPRSKEGNLTNNEVLAHYAIVTIIMVLLY